MTTINGDQRDIRWQVSGCKCATKQVSAPSVDAGAFGLFCYSSLLEIAERTLVQMLIEYLLFLPVCAFFFFLQKAAALQNSVI